MLVLAACLLSLTFLVVGFGLWQHAAGLPRTNVLILGVDRRPEEGWVVRSDTMILTTIYPPAPRAALLSIPRDLYVDVPGVGSTRINTAHFWGESYQAGGGPALAMETVALNFGVPVQHYVRLDFDGFRAMIDAVGGIDVDVPEAVVDDAYPTDDYGTIRIEIPAGRQHFDGETALQYARSRHGSSDFDRAARQQQIISAFMQRLAQAETWPRLPALLQAIREHLNTDLTPGQVLSLAPTLYRIGPQALERYTLDRDYVTPWTTPSGGAVLLPRWEVIDPLVDGVFAP